VLEQNKDLMRRFVEQVLNTKGSEGIERVRDFLSEDHVNHNDRSERGNGIEGMQNHILAVRRTYPDIEVTIDDQIAEGDLVVSRLTYRGTHAGKWLGIKPTGKKFTLEGAKIVRIREGRIVESWGFFNTLEALLEIGALRLPEQD
jgi:predicted ester cyclase